MAGKSNAEEEKEKKRKVLEEVICRRGGCAVLDGGLATQLQSHGANINDPLWGAVCLVTSPDLIKQVHTEYLEAGADIIVTASYQVQNTLIFITMSIGSGFSFAYLSFVCFWLNIFFVSC
eukprot:TRINITY_DN610_c0_g2_i7.p1 TRINITY_DN610_c0_g2~~TRINITY_DN610_c0_g2_i7.p1  ORF type:complete len:120 (+),score=9.45 TRINITY_DN610_c0_g2_i7:68-427(+)